MSSPAIESSLLALLGAEAHDQSHNRLSRYRPYPKQLEFHAAGKSYREVLLRAGNQCITPWTWIETPGGLRQSGNMFFEPAQPVLSWDGARECASQAGGWFLRGIEPAFRIVLDNGRFFDCSRRHLVLTCEGWISLDRLMSLSSGLRCWRTREDYQANCAKDGYLDDRSLLERTDSGQEQPPSQGDAPWHSLCWTLEDAEERIPECIRAYLTCDHHSIFDGGPRSYAALFDRFSGPNVSRPVLPLSENILQARQLLGEFSSQLRSGASPTRGRDVFLLLAGRREFFSCSDRIQLDIFLPQDDAPSPSVPRLDGSRAEAYPYDDRVAIFYPFQHPKLIGGASILAIAPLGFQPIIDLTVDKTHCYKAAGVYHHNCGKTLAASMELAMHLTGRYSEWWPGRRWNRPINAWAASETAQTTRDNIQRLMLGRVGAEGTGSVPGNSIIGKTAARGVSGLVDTVRIRHATGGVSTLTFKTYDQGRERWQGETLDIVAFDEEPPEDIYMEGLTRTSATGGRVWLTFTPLLGMSEVVRRFLFAHSPDRADINMVIEDAAHYTQEERAAIIASYPAHERDARTKGIPILGSGRIFPVVEESIAFDPFGMPAYWPSIAALDFGWDHPTACVWGRWDRDADTVYIYDAYRVKEATPVIHSAAIKARGDWIPVAWPHDGLQHSKDSGKPLADQYRAQGLAMLPEHAQHIDGTIGVEAGLMDMLDRMYTGRLKVARHLADWWEEFRLYHRKEGKVVKEGDDLMSATRYLCMSLRFARCKLQRPVDSRMAQLIKRQRSGRSAMSA